MTKMTELQEIRQLRDVYELLLKAEDTINYSKTNGITYGKHIDISINAQIAWQYINNAEKWKLN